MEYELIKYDFKDQYLWKFLDLHKFLYLINERKIYFTRLDMFEDPNEGLPEKLIFELYLNEIFYDTDSLNSSLFSTNEVKKDAKRDAYNAIIKLLNYADLFQKNQFASCWFLDNRESYAMWNLYSNSESVVVKIRPDILINQIKKEVTNLVDHSIDNFVSGIVHYNAVYPPEFEYEKYEEPKNQYSGLKKDLSYSYENEYRFLAISNLTNNFINKFELNIPDLYDLDFKVITHPEMQDWMFGNIKTILSKIGLEGRLQRSNIRLKPNINPDIKKMEKI
ncbi:MAG: DUF2971 domain-containing protein [Bacteroidales bacterium]